MGYELEQAAQILTVLAFAAVIIDCISVAAAGQNCIKYHENWVDSSGCGVDDGSGFGSACTHSSCTEPYCCLIAPGKAGHLQVISLVLGGVAFFALAYAMYATIEGFEKPKSTQLLALAIIAVVLQLIEGSFGIALGDACGCAKDDANPKHSFAYIFSAFNVAWAGLVLAMGLAAYFYPIMKPVIAAASSQFTKPAPTSPTSPPAPSALPAPKGAGANKKTT